MKIRQGFVSNSSSSSFICSVTGTIESGMDLSLEDAGMYECSNGHAFLDQYLVGAEDDPDIIPNTLTKIIEASKTNIDAALDIYKSYTNYSWRHEDKRKADLMEILFISNTDFEKALDKFEDRFYNKPDRYETKPENCPICTMKHFNNDELLNFIFKNKSRKELEDEIRQNYTYDEFTKIISS